MPYILKAIKMFPFVEAQTFQKGIWAVKHDPAPHLVFADWLDEKNFPKAAAKHRVYAEHLVKLSAKGLPYYRTASKWKCYLGNYEENGIRYFLHLKRDGNMTIQAFTISSKKKKS